MEWNVMECNGMECNVMYVCMYVDITHMLPIKNGNLGGFGGVFDIKENSMDSTQLYL